MEPRSRRKGGIDPAERGVATDGGSNSGSVLEMCNHRVQRMAVERVHCKVVIVDGQECPAADAAHGWVDA